MPNIVPVSDLKNYSTVLKLVSVGSLIYLTKEGRGRYAIIDISEQEEYEKAKASVRLMCELNAGKKSGEENGWIDLNSIKKHFEDKLNEL